MGAHYNLGNAFKELGECKKAISWYGKEIEIHPNYIKAYNNILFTLLYLIASNKVWVPIILVLEKIFEFP